MDTYRIREIPLTQAHRVENRQLRHCPRSLGGSCNKCPFYHLHPPECRKFNPHPPNWRASGLKFCIHPPCIRRDSLKESRPRLP